MDLLDLSATQESPGQFLARVGEVFVTFDERTQDSGNVSYGVDTDEGRFFVKTAGRPADKAHLSHRARVRLLRNAVRVSRALRDPSLCCLRNVIESTQGPMIVYDWAPGELIGTPKARRADPASPFARFKSLPMRDLTAALTSVFRIHAGLCDKGWVACDFYDGSMIYDFARGRLTLVDLDLYHEGPFINEMGRMFGSTRFMAPEEFEKGCEIDESTTVFTMGRCIFVFIGDRDRGCPSRGIEDLLGVGERACRRDKHARWASVRKFFEAWLEALAHSDL